MEGLSAEDKAVGVVFDLSLRQDQNGVGLVSLVKREMIKLVGENFADGHDAFYLYHPDIIEPTYKIGDHNSSIGNYETDGWQFKLEFALKQTLFVVAAEDRRFSKFVILISDRIQQKAPLDKLIYLNRKDMVDANIILIGVGNRYNTDVLKSAEADQSVTYYHVDHPSEIVAKLLKEEPHDEDVCCSPDEYCKPV
jgi:hypothetical protein